MEGHCLAKANKAEFITHPTSLASHSAADPDVCRARVPSALRTCRSWLATGPCPTTRLTRLCMGLLSITSVLPLFCCILHVCAVACTSENGPCGPPGNGADVGSCTSDCGGGGCGDRGALPAVFAAKRLLPGLAAAPAAPAPTWGLGSPTSLAKRLLMASLWLCTHVCGCTLNDDSMCVLAHRMMTAGCAIGCEVARGRATACVWLRTGCATACVWLDTGCAIGCVIAHRMCDRMCGCAQDVGEQRRDGQVSASPDRSPVILLLKRTEERWASGCP
eukprot:1161417-Pelagomonas_calceolata.AAC.5